MPFGKSIPWRKVVIREENEPTDVVFIQRAAALSFVGRGLFGKKLIK